MKYKHFARATLRLPEIGFGTWRYQGGVAPLRRGIDLGACLIDTAESYGTEEIVGDAVRGVRDRAFIATKALPRHFRHPDILTAADESLKRLRTEHIDLYQLHWPNYAVPIEETMAAMETLVENTVCPPVTQAIGVTSSVIKSIRRERAMASPSEARTMGPLRAR